MADQRRLLRKFEIESGREAKKLTPITLSHDGTELTASADGRWLAACGSNNVQVYKADTGSEFAKFFTKGLVQDLAFASDSKTRLVGGQGRDVAGHDPATGERGWRRDFGLPHGQYAIAMTPRTVSIAIVDGFVQIKRHIRSYASVNIMFLNSPVCRVSRVVCMRDQYVEE